jgi:hypothetical protein
MSNTQWELSLVGTCLLLFALWCLYRLSQAGRYTAMPFVQQTILVVDTYTGATTIRTVQSSTEPVPTPWMTFVTMAPWGP